PSPASTTFLSHPTPTPRPYTLSLHDALPISGRAAPRAGIAASERQGAADRREHAHARAGPGANPRAGARPGRAAACAAARPAHRSEEHTSELQSRGHLVCRLLLEKKNNTPTP